jgi:hypothetical protein
LEIISQKFWKSSAKSFGENYFWEVSKSFSFENLVSIIKFSLQFLNELLFYVFVYLLFIFFFTCSTSISIEYIVINL